MTEEGLSILVLMLGGAEGWDWTHVRCNHREGVHRCGSKPGYGLQDGQNQTEECLG